MTQFHAKPSFHKSAAISKVLWLCVFLLAGLLAMSRSKADPDLWGHVTYGKEVIRDGHLHPYTTWSYAVDDFRWVNHENIAELMLAAADNFAGQHGLLLMKSLLTLLVLGLPTWVASRNGASNATLAMLVALLAFNISFHWLVRPHMLSYACAAGLMACIAVGLPGATRHRDDQKFGKCLWLIPPLMCFWTNAHGGYLAGMAILMAWLGLDAIELLLHKDVRLKSTVRHHAILFSATVAACMLNPYGWELHTWMLSSLGRPRPEISEWAPLPLLSVDGLPFWCLAGITFLCLKRSTAAKRWPAMIVMALLAWQAVRHHRHLPFVAILATFVLAPHIESLICQIAHNMKQRVSQGGEQKNRRTSCLVAGMIIVVLSFGQFFRQNKLHVDKNYYPVSAMQFMHDHQLSGNVFVTFNWAQYALAVFSEVSPESRIAFDGRFRTCYPQHVIDMYFDFILGDLPKNIRYREDQSGPFDPTRALTFADPNLVLFERARTNCSNTMQKCSDEWCLLYQDSLAQLWGRREVYDDPNSRNYLHPAKRSITDQSQEGSIAWPAIPRQQNGESDNRSFVVARPSLTPR